MSEEPQSPPTFIHVELEDVADRLVSLLNCAESVRAHVLENLAPDCELLKRIDLTHRAARDALLLVAHLQLMTRQRTSSGLMPAQKKTPDERPTVRVPRRAR
jgi:hypothetical protein